MEQKELYAEQWNNSANYFYDNGSYLWMCKAIKKYHTILEIGCGTGQSTLSLLENEHKVIVVEKNQFCIEKAKSLLKEKGYSVGTIESSLSDCDVIFLSLELFDDNLLELLSHISLDAAICWNVGSYWDESMQEYYIPIMLDYGLTNEQIHSNPESSYGELIIWQSCKIARKYNVPINIVERAMQISTKWNDDYYVTLKRDFNFSKIKYKNIKTKAMSEGGRRLSTNGVQHRTNEINLYLSSITIIP